jgi:hypothetical protein
LFSNVPWWPLPETSGKVVPTPASKLYAATRPAPLGRLGVVADATFEYAPRLPAASTASTR